jgi:hypothetical protein
MKSFYLQVGYVTRQMSYTTSFKNQSNSYELLNILGGTTEVLISP